jgi:septum formation protein
MSSLAASAQMCLASRSPRRAELLRLLGVRFDVRPADLEEVPAAGQSPADYSLATALAKARAVARCAPERPVLGADTDVVLDGQILGKPRCRADALAMLARLSGRVHEVYSAVAVVSGARQASALSVTRVHFGPIRHEDAAAYWDSGEPADKAGAYAIQGYAARWVKSIEGSYSGVVGLPLYETAELLERFGIVPAPAGRRAPSAA